MNIHRLSSFSRFHLGLGAALVSALASTLCCIGPLIYLMFGISAVSALGLEAYGWIQLPMIMLSLGLMIRGFWRLYLSPKPICTGRLSVTSSHILFWLTVPLVLALQVYPYVLPWFLE